MFTCLSICLPACTLQELTAGIPCVIDDIVEITSEAQIFSLPLLAQVGDGGGDEPVPSPTANESKAAASLRSEVTQASAAMAVATKVRAKTAAAKTANTAVISAAASASVPAAAFFADRHVAVSSFFATQDDLVEGTGVARPAVPEEVEWVPKDVDAMTLDELKDQAFKQASFEK